MPPPNDPDKHDVNADSGTTGNYFALKDVNCLHDVREAAPHEVVTVTLPAGEEIQSSHVGILKFSPDHQGQQVHVFKSLWGSLLGIGDLCDAGLIAVFDKDRVYIVDLDSETVVLTGERDAHTRLWMIALKPIQPNEEKQAVKSAAQIAASTVVKHKSNTKKQSTSPQHISPAQKTSGKINKLSEQKHDSVGDRVEFFSRTFCSPAESSLMEAVKKQWIRFPGISYKVLKRHRHRLRTHESAAGHLDQVHQNHQPSRPHLSPPPKDESELPTLPILTHIHVEGNHMDATGRYPAMSHRGHQYVLILYSDDGNYIKPIAMTDRTKQSYLKAHKEAMHYFVSRGYKPTFQRLDNETSTAFEDHLKKNDIKVDLVPPNQHRRNKAERAIRTFKNHFIALMAGVDPAFPMCAWNELLEHAEITVNLLRKCPAHPRLSAWEGLNGAYDYDAHPLAPPGTAVTVYESPEQRKSWAKHGVKGFYLGPTSKHYRCYRVWVTTSASVRIADTLAWHPHGYQWDVPTPVDMLVECSNMLTAALKNLATTDPHVATHGQPLQVITEDIRSNLEALRHLYQLAPAAEHDETPVATQRVAETPAAPQRVAETPAAPQRVVETSAAPQRVDETLAAPRQAQHASICPQQRRGGRGEQGNLWPPASWPTRPRSPHQAFGVARLSSS